jgi:hypothetical protein
VYPSNKTGMIAWCQQLARLMRSWWRADRIRVSPREGRLRRLACGTLLRICDQWFEIESRTVTAGPGAVLVTYECTAANRKARLHVQTANAGDADSVRWQDAAADREVDAATIEIFERQPGTLDARVPCPVPWQDD